MLTTGERRDNVRVIERYSEGWKKAQDAMKRRVKD